MEELSISLTQRQREIALAYGYPFDPIKDQLEKSKGSSKSVTIKADNFWWVQLSGDLARSLNHNEIRDRFDIEDAEELFEIIECELR